MTVATMPQSRRSGLARRLTAFFVEHPFKGSVPLRSAIAKMLVPPSRGPVIAPSLYGFDMIVDPVLDRGLEESIYYGGTYEPGTLWVMANCLRAGDTFVDVGANIGWMSVFAARRVGAGGAVYAFEADPDTYSILQQNIALNHLGNVHTFPLALGSAKGTLTLYSNRKFNRGASSFVPPSTGNTAGVTVHVETLDAFLSVPSLRMLKVDVEGWEAQVLEGARDLLSGERAPIVCVEYSRENARSGQESVDIWRYLVGINAYRVFRLKRGKESISKLIPVTGEHDLPRHDNLFCFRVSHLSEVPKRLFC